MTRPGRYGNPHPVGRLCPACGVEHTADEAIAEFRAELEAPEAFEVRENIRQELRGKQLACWCKLDQPCHADVLAEFANGGPA